MADLIECQWTGEAFIPLTAFMRRRASERFGEGEIVLLNAEEERSKASHRHYFASLKDLWLNLPERFAVEPWAQSAEHFRKWLLIRCGYNTAQTYACQTKAEAMRLAAAIRPLAEFNVVAVREATVLRFEAQSQSVKAMGKKAFQESKDAVLGAAEALVATGEIPEMAA